MRRTLVAIAALAFFSMSPIHLARADSGATDDLIFDANHSDGTRTSATIAQVGNFASGKDLKGAAFAAPMEFQVRLACQIAVSGDSDPSACQKAVAGCQSSSGPIGIGLLHDIYGRPRDGSQPWRYLGSTCFADQVPGATPTITLAQIIRAFHLTPWATATVTTQPEGNVTLVGLPTYARVTWSAAGFQPGEVDTLDPATMLGFTVQIRPRLDHHTYHFGDAHTVGPTRSDGAPWPDGDVTHAYTTPGTYAARVDTTFTGDFRINSGPWTQIPDTVTVTGPNTTITVHTAAPILVN